LSSTNRSNTSKQNRSINKDYYVTPIHKIMEFLNEIKIYEPNILNGKILDPCAGGDASHPMSYPEAIKQSGGTTPYTIDIREDSLAELKTNYLTYNCKNKYDLIITNPPFNLAKDIIYKALDDIKDNGFVIMLLRLNFFGSKDRKDLWEYHMPKYTFVHHRRISFLDDGSTDSIEYAHFVWQKGYKPEFTMLKVI
jgi:hypothetical protein